MMLKDYNTHMGYVDKADMLKSLYEIDRKSKKWWHRIFWHFLDVAVTNAFIIYKEKCNNDFLLNTYRLAIVNALIGYKMPNKKGRKSLPSTFTGHKVNISNEKRFSLQPHLPITKPSKRSRCIFCSNKTNDKRSIWYCNTCNVALCLNVERNCFFEFHKVKLYYYIITYI